jgi:hypothetical protein
MTYKIRFKKISMDIRTEHDGHRNTFQNRWSGKSFYAIKSEYNNWFYFYEYNRRDRMFLASIEWIENIVELP